MRAYSEEMIIQNKTYLGIKLTDADGEGKMHKTEFNQNLRMQISLLV